MTKDEALENLQDAMWYHEAHHEKHPEWALTLLAEAAQAVLEVFA